MPPRRKPPIADAGPRNRKWEGGGVSTATKRWRENDGTSSKRENELTEGDGWKLVRMDDSDTGDILGYTYRPRWPEQIARNRKVADEVQAAPEVQVPVQAAARVAIDADAWLPTYMSLGEDEPWRNGLSLGDEYAPINISSDTEAPTAKPSTVEVPAPEPVDLGPPLIEEQQRVVDLIVQGHNVFYTGSAGCGKSTVLKAAVRRLHQMGMTVQVVAPTGKAALVVGGMTTWSYMGWTPDHVKIPRKALLKAAGARKVWQRLKKTDVLIIDEISMVENHLLERMDAVMRKARQPDLFEKGLADPFGGVQLIVSGDFCQLAPVKPFEYCPQCGKKIESDGEEYDCPENHGPWNDDDKWAFRSDVWELCKFVHINLTKVHRQSDKAFVGMLQQMRLGKPLNPVDVDVLMDHECDVKNATQLFSRRDEVKRFNDTKFSEMKTPVHTYNFLDGYEEINQHEENPVPDSLVRRFSDGSLVKLDQHRFEREVNLRGGMLVLLLTNLDIQGGLVNGSTGIIIGFEEYDPAKLPQAPRGRDEVPEGIDPIYGDYANLMDRSVRAFARYNQAARSSSQGRGQGKLMWPRVRFLDNGTERVIYPHCSVSSELYEGGQILLHRTQLPLMPGWAVTIHKCQGMTLNRVVVDLSHAFEYEQVYVALSRAKSLGGLKIIGGRRMLEQANGGSAAVRQFLKDRFGLSDE